MTTSRNGKQAPFGGSPEQLATRAGQRQAGAGYAEAQAAVTAARPTRTRAAQPLPARPHVGPRRPGWAWRITTVAAQMASTRFPGTVTTSCRRKGDRR